MKLALIAAVGLAATVGAAGDVALAGPKDPITKTYTATAPTPDPTNAAAATHQVCNMVVPQSFHIEKFAAPGPGALKVEIDGFVGDWDLLIQDSKGRDVAAATATDTSTPVAPDPDSTAVKVKKAETYSIIACNWVGGPTATVKYTFTFAK